MSANQIITKGTSTCPDCGNEQAFTKTIRSCDRQGNPEPGYYLVIDCEACEYYEFTYQGPDI